MDDTIDLTEDDAELHDQQLHMHNRSALEAEERTLLVEITARQRRISQIRGILQELDAADQHRQQQLTAAKFLGGASPVVYPWSQLLSSTRSSVFGIDEWRPMQKEICDCVLSGHDCMVFLPAGSGKSLCFQLPALMFAGRLTLVISPLLALMHDQVVQLQQNNIRAAKLTKDTPKQSIETIYDSMNAGNLSLLYVSPEKLVQSKRLQSTLSKIYASDKIARIAIDEAHCCSQWGHDFRPDYKKLGLVRKLCPQIGITALTATADQRTADDLRQILGLQSNAIVFRQSCDRPNLYYEVRWKPSSASAIAGEIAGLIQDRFRNQSGIIYALSQKDCETIAMQLTDLKINCACYHAGFDSEAKDHVYARWQDNSIQVVVATIAFGMGVSKPDVRFVIHQCMSKSLSGYYQEAGRAGRDGHDAACIVFYSPQDALRLAGMGVESHNGELHLIDMLHYCQDLITCRHVLIERHFGETTLEGKCGRYCDNCTRPANDLIKRDVAGPVKALIAEFRQIDRSMTVEQLSAGWRGLGSAEHKLPESVQLNKKTFTKPDAQRIIIHLIVIGYLSFSYAATSYNVQAYVKAGVNRNPVPDPFLITFFGAKGTRQKSDEHSKFDNEDSKPKRRKLSLDLLK